MMGAEVAERGSMNSEDTLRIYRRLRALWSRELALELTRIIVSINYLKEELDGLRREVDYLKTLADLRREGGQWLRQRA